MGRRNRRGRPRSEPSYNLSRIRELARWEPLVNGNARRDAREHFGFRVQDILECVLALREAHFTRSNLHNKKYGIWVDHYQIIYEDEPVYLHFYVEGDTLVINSFKRDDEA